MSLIAHTIYFASPPDLGCARPGRATRNTPPERNAWATATTCTPCPWATGRHPAFCRRVVLFRPRRRPRRRAVLPVPSRRRPFPSRRHRERSLPRPTPRLRILWHQRFQRFQARIATPVATGLATPTPALFRLLFLYLVVPNLRLGNAPASRPKRPRWKRPARGCTRRTCTASWRDCRATTPWWGARRA